MLTTAANKPEHVSWFVPFLAFITFAIFTATMASIPVLFKEIALDLNLDVVQIGSVWGMTALGGIFIMPIGGILCDRLGIKRTIVMMGLLTGLTGALIGLSNGFLSLMATTFLWGLLSSAVMPALSMVVSRYSSSQRQGLAQGLLSAGGGLGLTLGSLTGASLLSPLLEGWRNVFFLFGGITILITLVWQFRVKKSESTAFREVIPFRRVFIHLLRLKPLWVVSLAAMVYMGCVTGMQGLLPYHLEVNGWTTIAAGGSLSAFAAAGTIGVIPLAILSDRIGSRKIPILVACLTAIVGIGLLSVIHNGILWVLVILAGFLSPMCAALFITLCIEIKEVKADYKGTALGLMGAIVGAGKTVIPPLGNSLANISTIIAWPFIFWAALAAVGAVILIFIRETGWRNEAKRISSKAS